MRHYWFFHGVHKADLGYNSAAPKNAHHFPPSRFPWACRYPGHLHRLPAHRPPALSRESTLLCAWEGEEQRGNWQRCKKHPTYKTSAVLASGSNLGTVGSQENPAPNPTHTTQTLSKRCNIRSYHDAVISGCFLSVQQKIQMVPLTSTKYL